MLNCTCGIKNNVRTYNSVFLYFKCDLGILANDKLDDCTDLLWVRVKIDTKVFTQHTLVLFE